MYADHNRQIAAGMREDPETFIRGALFAVLSIRQPVIFVPEMLDDVYREGRDCTALFGHKRDAYDYLQENGTALWQAVCGTDDARGAVLALTACPGLGIVKAAFVAQLAGHDVACLDSRNLRRLGMKQDTFESRGRDKVRPAFRRKLDKYLALVQGRAEEFWDDWCSDVAPRWKSTAQEISALHLSIIN